MTELLEQAVATARSLSPEMQDEIARVMLALANDAPSIHPMTAAQDPADAQKARGDHVTEEAGASSAERAELLRRLEEISARAGRLPVFDPRSADEILGYDENGVPS